MDSPILAHDGRTMTFGKNKFFRCSDGTYRDKRNATLFERGELFEGVAPPARSVGNPTSRPVRNTGGGSAGNNIQRLKLELEIEAGK